MARVGLGGGCHWCTEGVFQSLIGIKEVQQGWIASEGENAIFSEAILVEFDEKIISLKTLIEIHLYTHSSTSAHSFRDKYRSAVYVFDQNQKAKVEGIMSEIQKEFKGVIITKVLYYIEFKTNEEAHLNYLYTRKNNGFCENYIHPKLRLLLSKFDDKVDAKKIEELKIN